MNMDIDRLFTDDEIIERGRRAKALLENDLVREALNAVAEQCYKDFVDADPTDLNALSDARMMLKTADRFVKYFRKVIGEGDSAAANAQPKRPVI